VESPSQTYHRPVLVTEVLEVLALRPAFTVVDGTLGGGGHALAMLECIQPQGLLVGLDLDADALRAAELRLTRFADRVRLVRASFRDLDRVLAGLGIEHVDAVLLDLGVSSHQLDRPERGFRFAGTTASETPLDMRLGDGDARPTAAELLQQTPESELARIFAEYGELPGSYRLAREIAARRRRAPLRSAADLLAAIEAAGVGRGRKHNAATLVFQALRIAVNDELGTLRDGLGAAISRLRPGGRLAVIAYHSLEDRIVKQRFRVEERGCSCPPEFPVCRCGGVPRLEILTKRPLRPSAAEIAENPRARSARLRAAARVAEAA
jgi:16S rRNA (cytosine1402-N4)-methyltransferase